MEIKSISLYGGLTAVAMLTANTLGIIAVKPIYLVSTVVCGILLDLMIRDGKYDKLFRSCGLENKNKQIPLVIRRYKKNDTTTLVLHLPAGISQHHFEQKKEELEQFLNAKIEFAYNKNLIMNITANQLKSLYPYSFEQCKNPLEIMIGYSDYGKFTLDIENCPHVLIAGETGSGKSTLLDTIALSAIFNSADIDLHMIDFQGVGLGKYEQCHKVRSYGETPKDFEELMNNMAEESERRLRLFKSVKNRVYIDKLRAWNELYPKKAMPYKLVLIDEFARLAESQYDYLMEQFRTRVSMDRKAGIHYIVSVSRPDVKIISGSIKGNIPVRIAFKVVTDTDSEVILDIKGAEKIKNPGRCIIKYMGELREVQCSYIESKRIRKALLERCAYKTDSEIKSDKAVDMKRRRDKCINPYIKGAI